MKRTILCAISLLLIASMTLCLSSCGLKIHAGNLMDGMRVTPPRELTEDTDRGAVALTRFAISLAENASAPGKNTLVSPLSVAFALAMTANGADGETLSQMETVLGMPVSDLNDFFSTYRFLRENGTEGKNDLKIANSIWFTDKPSFTVGQNFLQANADYYGSDVYAAPFDRTTLRDINNWVKDKTEGMIPEILDEIPPEALMYLVNALAFDAEWETPYTEFNVRDGSFTTSGGQSKAVEFLHGTEYAYLEDANATGFVKYYQGRGYAFVALLPNEGMTPEEYLGTLDADHLYEMLAHPLNDFVRTAMPKFETSFDTDLSNVLSDMGMPQAFDGEKADFSKLGTSAEGNVCIGRVLHKTYMALNEKGTRAGAATAVEMKTESTAIDTDGKVVRLDRPFVYLLIDCETNLPLFIGTMNAPTK